MNDRLRENLRVVSVVVILAVLTFIICGIANAQDTLKISKDSLIELRHDVQSGNVVWLWDNTVIPNADKVEINGKQYLKINSYSDGYLVYRYGIPVKYDTVAFYHIWQAPSILSFTRSPMRVNSGDSVFYNIQLTNNIDLDDIQFFVDGVLEFSTDSNEFCYQPIYNAGMIGDSVRLITKAVVENLEGSDTSPNRIVWLYKPLTIDAVKIRSNNGIEVIEKLVQDTIISNFKILTGGKLDLIVGLSGATTLGQDKEYYWFKDGVFIYKASMNHYNETCMSILNFKESDAGVYTCQIYDKIDSMVVATFIVDKESIIMGNSKLNNDKVYGVDNGIRFNLDNNKPVLIYSVGSVLVYSGNIQDGKIDLQKGVYIVIVDHKKVYKVKL